jgi:hypothetical protein
MNLLARLGYYRLDTGAVARALAATLLHEYDAAVLEPTATLQFLRTRYMRLVADYGLPAEACDTVAAQALALVRQSIPATDPIPFAFYD